MADYLGSAPSTTPENDDVTPPTQRQSEPQQQHRSYPQQPLGLTSDDLAPGNIVNGILPNQAVTIVTATPVRGSSDLIKIVYEQPDGGYDSEILDAASLATLSLVQDPDSATIPRFDADPDNFRLAAEALRIKNAAAYDPMSAVYSSNIDPLPHQIRAVYQDMLPKVPLRFLLADDPGAGKTVMAGLYIREMLLRCAASRVIIVCPGGLAEQWQDEMSTKFNLDFDIFSPTMQNLSPTGNPFRDYDLVIARMDQIARNDDFRRMLSDVRWDIAVVDEAHRMSAHYRNIYGDTDKTKRFRLGETLSRTSENLLLMTATPHSGNESDFQLFLSLLDKDRFMGDANEKKHQRTDTKDVMRRMVKEEMLTFEGKHLFPERHATTVQYPLSSRERELYDRVTDYVRNGMNNAQQIMKSDKRRGNSIGFALTVLQRRLASSPEAIYRSLQRRHDKLQTLLDNIDKNPADIANILSGRQSGPSQETSPFTRFSPTMDDVDDLWDETDENDQADFENDLDVVVDSATAARSRAELATEITTLDGLVDMARQLLIYGQDTKWIQLSDILQQHVLDSKTTGTQHKLIVFTEHRDTLNYLCGRIAQLLGKPEAVCAIHGGLNRDDRRTVQECFVNDPSARILVATDAAGEGLNLQRADLMVNYDLPWNPNRIEQRFGRIHRIGQRNTCFLWNMVAEGTREGDVYARLLDKIATMGKAYGGRLFNVLGDSKAFDGRSLADLMVDAIRRNDNSSNDWLDRIIDASVGEGLKKLKDEESADKDNFLHLTANDVDTERHRMEEHRERKLLPGYVEAFFVTALDKLNGSIHRREHHRWEITHIPSRIIRKAKSINRHRPVAERYERVTFDPAYIDVNTSSTKALLIAPGSPLLEATIEVVLEQYGDELDKGAIFVDDTDSQPDGPVLVTAASQEITDSSGNVLSRSFDYLQLDEADNPSMLPIPPYSDFRAARPDELALIDEARHTAWFRRDHSDELQDFIYISGTKDRLDAMQQSHDAERQHLLEQIDNRLTRESEYWWGIFNDVLEQERQGHSKRAISSVAAEKHAKEIDARHDERVAELSHPDRLHARPAKLHGLALVFPGAMFDSAGGHKQHDQQAKDGGNAHLPRNQREVDARGVALTMAIERGLGRTPTEMPHNNKGYDIESYDSHGSKIIIEVKSRIDFPDHDFFFVSSSEITTCKNQGDHHRLALALISPDGPEHDSIRYVAHAFDSLIVAPTTRQLQEVFHTYWERGVEPF